MFPDAGPASHPHSMRERAQVTVKMLYYIAGLSQVLCHSAVVPHNLSFGLQRSPVPPAGHVTSIFVSC